MVWAPIDVQWQENYNLAKKYYINNGDLLIPSRYEINCIKLGRWIHSQRQNYKNHKLSEEKIKLLEEIGIIWSIKQAC